MQKTADPITSRRVMVFLRPFELYPEQCQCTARLLPLTWHEPSHVRRNDLLKAPGVDAKKIQEQSGNIVFDSEIPLTNP